jgi:SH3-like domain-containing protein
MRMPARLVPWLHWTLVAGLLVAPSWMGFRSREAGASPAYYVRVKVETANLRTGPSLSAEPVRYAYENEPLRVMARQGDWVKIRDFEGESAWIYGPLTDRRSAVVVTRDLVNVREQPGTDHPVVFTAERAVNLLVLDRRGPWLHVQHDLGDGWVHDSLVWGEP